MSIFDDITAAGENAVDFAIGKAKELNNDIQKLLKLLKNVSQAESKTNNVQNELQSKKRNIDNYCSDIYKVNGANVSKTFVDYVDNLTKENNNSMKHSLNDALDLFDTIKKTINELLKKTQDTLKEVIPFTKF
ncbi:MAG: hypothetical protein MR398_07410 [Oscillospiraceae bacterium]|nr:hypothetical protein [Oscillospiraceae bacterium]